MIDKIPYKKADIRTRKGKASFEAMHNKLIMNSVYGRYDVARRQFNAARQQIMDNYINDAIAREFSRQVAQGNL